MSEPTLRFATFWDGKLSPYEAACLLSFSRLGYEITIFCYRDIGTVPAGIKVRHASDLVGEDLKDRFLFQGKPDIRHFSDYFRFVLSRETDLIWTDADVLLIRRLDRRMPATILTQEWSKNLCNSVLRIDRADPRLDLMISKCESMMGRQLVWGQTGPLMLTKLFQAELRNGSVLPPSHFYPIDFGLFWKALTPEFCGECEEMAKEAYGVHLWNNLLQSLGIWKIFAPPVGSYLYEQLAAAGLLGLFQGAYDPAPFRQMVENWRLRKTGGDLGIRQIVRQVGPSISRTMRHYRGH